MSSVLLFGLIAPGTIFRNREYKITSWEMSFKILGQDECPALPGESCRWAQEMARKAAERRSRVDGHRGSGEET